MMSKTELRENLLPDSEFISRGDIDYLTITTWLNCGKRHLKLISSADIYDDREYYFQIL